MFESLLRAVGFGKGRVAESEDQALEVDKTRLRSIAQEYRDNKESGYFKSLPSKPELDLRAQTIADEITKSIPGKLEANARTHGWDFEIIELISFFSRLPPAEHQARILAVPLILEWCSRNGLAAHTRASPFYRDDDSQIDNLKIHIRF